MEHLPCDEMYKVGRRVRGYIKFLEDGGTSLIPLGFSDFHLISSCSSFFFFFNQVEINVVGKLFCKRNFE